MKLTTLINTLNVKFLRLAKRFFRRVPFLENFISHPLLCSIKRLKILIGFAVKIDRETQKLFHYEFPQNQFFIFKEISILSPPEISLSSRL